MVREIIWVVRNVRGIQILRVVIIGKPERFVLDHMARSEHPDSGFQKIDPQFWRKRNKDKSPIMAAKRYRQLIVSKLHLRLVLPQT